MSPEKDNISDNQFVIEDARNTSSLMTTYAQRFADAGNTVVTAMFALAFGIYIILASSSEARSIAAKYCLVLLVMAIVSNLALVILIYRLWREEIGLISQITQHPQITRATRAAMRIRWWLLGANAAIYLTAITLNSIPYGYPWWPYFAERLTPSHNARHLKIEFDF